MVELKRGLRTKMKQKNFLKNHFVFKSFYSTI